MYLNKQELRKIISLLERSLISVESGNKDPNTIRDIKTQLELFLTYLR